MIICHETIYAFIYEEKQEWRRYLRQRKGRYRRRRGIRTRERCKEEAKKRRIDARPSTVEARSRIGDWEGDTIVGGEKTTGIITYVERMSGYLLGDLILKKSAQAVKEKTVARFKKIPDAKKHIITYDNGAEFSGHESIGRETGMDIYFAYPYHFWERGTNENTNGILRKFFPKKSIFAKLKQKDVDRVVKLINDRPRKRLGYLTPYEIFIEGKNCSSRQNADSRPVFRPCGQNKKGLNLIYQVRPRAASVFRNRNFRATTQQRIYLRYLVAFIQKALSPSPAAISSPSS